MLTKLESGSITASPGTSGIKKYIEEFRPRLSNKHICEVVQENCFKKCDDVELYYKLCAYLLLSDEWVRPIQKNYADILFFALCNNCARDNGNIIITNMSQAATLFKETDNDYKALRAEKIEGTVRYESYTGEAPFFVKGFTFKFKIPVRFFHSPKQGTMRMMDMKKPPLFCVNDDNEIQLDWKVFRGFFDGNKYPAGRLAALEGEKIGKFFNFNYKTMIEIMNFAGFRRIRDLNMQEIFDIGVCEIQDNKLVVLTLRKGDTELDGNWFKNGVLLPSRDYFILDYDNQKSLSAI